MKPTIGITTAPRTVEDRWLEALDRGNVDAVVQAGGLPVMLPVVEPSDAAALLDHLDGLLLTGGVDVDPSAYGQQRIEAVTTTDPTRDAHELALTRGAFERHLPILGMCRGAQLLNVAAGGTLIQDIATQTPIEHLQRPRFAEVVHEVRVDPSSCLATIVGTEPIAVNTMHHQAVAAPGGGLRAVAWAEDGLIEAVEAVDGSPVLGVQWHPELLLGLPAHDALFRWLVEVAAAARPAQGRRHQVFRSA
jgi:putative glutamine amidotransferase